MKVREPKGQKPQLDRERAPKTHTDHNTPPTRRGTELHKLENCLFFSSGIYRCFVVGCQSTSASITVSYTAVCTQGSVFPPGRSPVHRPRGLRSATATSAGAAAGPPARRGRRRLKPGSSPPEGLTCQTTDHERPNYAVFSKSIQVEK